MFFSYCRQLSVERDSLAMSLEKETRKVSRLSMEKEELLWRFRESSHLSQSSPALNHDISPTFSPIEADRSHRSKSSTLPANRSLKTQSLYLPALEDDDFTVL